MTPERDLLGDLMNPARAPTTARAPRPRIDAEPRASRPRATVTGQMRGVVDPSLESHVTDMLSSLRGRGYDVRIGETYRTPERQRQYFREGRSRTTTGLHPQGRAVDLIVYGANGQPDWNTRNPAWRAIGEEAETRGLGWGGRFRTLVDLGHVQLDPVRGANNQTQTPAPRDAASLDDLFSAPQATTPQATATSTTPDADPLADLLRPTGSAPRFSSTSSVEDADEAITIPEGTPALSFEPSRGDGLSLPARAAVGWAQRANNIEPNEQDPSLVGHATTVRVAADANGRVDPNVVADSFWASLGGENYRRAAQRYRQETGRNLGAVSPEDLARGQRQPDGTFQIELAPAQETIRAMNAYIRGGLPEAQAEAARIRDEQQGIDEAQAARQAADQGIGAGVRRGVQRGMIGSAQLMENVGTMGSAVAEIARHPVLSLTGNSHLSPEWQATAEQAGRDQAALNAAEASVPHMNTTGGRVADSVTTGLMSASRIGALGAGGIPAMATLESLHRGPAAAAQGYAMSLPLVAAPVAASGVAGRIGGAVASRAGETAGRIAANATERAANAGVNVAQEALLNGRRDAESLITAGVMGAALPVGAHDEAVGGTGARRSQVEARETAVESSPRAGDGFDAWRASVAERGELPAAETNANTLPAQAWRVLRARGYEATPQHVERLIEHVRAANSDATNLALAIERDFPVMREGVNTEAANTPAPLATEAQSPAPRRGVLFTEREGYGARNRIVTPERYDAARARLRERFAPSRLNAGVDMGALGDLGEIAVFHLEADVRAIPGGVRDFRSWSQAMVADMGEGVRPHLRSLYGRARREMRERERSGNAANTGRAPMTPAELYGDFERAATTQPDALIPAPPARSNAGRPARPAGAVGHVLDAVNAPRALMASGDVSAPGRQGLILSLTEPRIAARAMRSQFRSYASQRAHEGVVERLATHPDAPLAEASGLYLASRHGSGEEMFASRLIQKLPHVRTSERAYVAYLDELRMGAFERYARELERAGYTPDTSSESYQSIARWINHATGRGDFRVFERAANRLTRSSAGTNAAPLAELLSLPIFAPHYTMSRFQLLNPVNYARMAPGARRIAIRKMVEFAGVVGTTLFLARQMGAQVSTDPESPDFLKIRVGNMRLDMLGGLQQPMRFIYRLGNSTYRRARGARLQPNEQPVSIVSRFARSKFSPALSYAADALTGTDYVGEPFEPLGHFTNERGQFSPGGGAVSRVLPMLTNDVTDAFNEYGLPGTAVALPLSALGVPASTYDETQGRGGQAQGRGRGRGRGR
jgi:hypothetical protein